jgi:hypothetical protein
MAARKHGGHLGDLNDLGGEKSTVEEAQEGVQEHVCRPKM